MLGARVVALAGGRNLDFVRGLGAEEALDHRTTALSALGRFDVVLDTVGTEQARVRRLLAPGGRMVAVAPDLDRPLAWIGTVLGSVAHGKGASASSVAIPTARCSPRPPGSPSAVTSSPSWTPSTRSTESPTPNGPWPPGAFEASTSCGCSRSGNRWRAGPR